MSRQEELKCLEKVKCGISEEYYLNKQIRSHSFGQRMECNYYCKESGRIAEALINAKENPNENDFPDFIVVGGFIEHFTVSAAKENRHGSEYRKKESEINRKWQSEFENEKEEFLNSVYTPNQININTKGENLDIFTYKNFKNSFCRNWDNHINSLKKYSGDKSIGIFLVEYKGALLKEMNNGRFIGFYQLNRDKETLQYIFDNRDFLRYVIFTDGQYFEIIAIKDIPELIKNIGKDVAFEGGKMLMRRVDCLLSF
ncbi:MAG: hypothetical protein ACLU5E_06810 [Anaerovoracaceae bacterium]